MLFFDVVNSGKEEGTGKENATEHMPVNEEESESPGKDADRLMRVQLKPKSKF